MSERSRSLSVVLSEGYAPYEQYHRRGEQGPWTDIYASAAVLYHVVAGEPPPPATERMSKDELDIPALGVSASLSNALALGLATDHHKRPQRMTEFQGLLLGDGTPQVLAGVVKQMPEKAIQPPPETIVVSRPAPPPASGYGFIWTALVVVIGIIWFVMGNRGTESVAPSARNGGGLEVAGQTGDAAVAGTSSAVQEVRQTMPPTPDPKDALKVLFGLSAPGDFVRVDGAKSARVWFSRLFQVGSEEVFVVFVSVFTLDKEGKPIGCHVCSPSVGAATYKLSESKWTVVSKQLDIAQLGTWGEAPAIANAEILELATGHVALLFEGGSMGQGYTEGGTSIIDYSQNKWQFLGHIPTYGDNAGTCDDSPSGRLDPDMQRCWKYSGKLSLEPNQKRRLSNIIVNLKGTVFNLEKNLIIPVVDTRYVFNGKEYVLEAEFNSRKK